MANLCRESSNKVVVGRVAKSGAMGDDSFLRCTEKQVLLIGKTVSYERNYCHC